ncbi:hypothetical protein BZA77DRAFT_359999 [Pyronema omphalodes]|nr:hypothetical protein BZA77DRAFT_359999 [Pyronema omphalodes]
MCLPPARTRPAPRSSREKHSSSGTSSDASPPASPDLKSPPPRVATSPSKPRTTSYVSASAAVPTRRKSHRERDGSRTRSSAAPARSSRRDRRDGTSAIASPELSGTSDFGESRESKREKRSRSRTSKSASLASREKSPEARSYLSPNIATVVSAASPRKSSGKAYSTSSSARNSIGTAASIAASTSPLLKPGGGSRASSDAGSEQRTAERNTRETEVVGLGIGFEAEKPKKLRSSKKDKKDGKKEKRERSTGPAPTIQVSTASDVAVDQSVQAPAPASTAPPAATIVPAVKVAAPPPPRPPIVRQNAYVSTKDVPNLKRKGTISSLSSAYSSSESVQTAEETLNNAEENNPATKPTTDGALVQSPKLPSYNYAPSMTYKYAEPPPLMAPLLPTQRRGSKSSRRPSVDIPVKEPPPVQTAKKASPPRSVSRASTETVDYAAFVAEQQQRKKAEKKLRSLLPEDTQPPAAEKPSAAPRRDSLLATPNLAAAAVFQNTKTAPAGFVPFDALTDHSNAVMRFQTHSDSSDDSDSTSDRSLVATSVAPVVQGMPSRLRRNSTRRNELAMRSKTPDARPRSVISLRMGPPPEVPTPPPCEPSPGPPRRRRRDARQPPRGAGGHWYTAGAEELEQDWEGEVWGDDGRPVERMPRAPSPPVSGVGGSGEHDDRDYKSRDPHRGGYGRGYGQEERYYGYGTGSGDRRY